MRKKIAVILALTFVFNIISYSAFAEISAEDKQIIQQKQAELQNIQSQIGAKEENVQRTRKKARIAHEELKKVESALRSAEKDLSRVNSSLQSVQSKMNTNEKLLKEAQSNLEERNHAYSKRIRDIYMHGQLNYLDVLFGAKDFADFTTRFELLMRIVKNDIGLIDEIKSEQQKVREQQEKLELDKQEIQKLRDEQLAKKELIASKQKERKVVFDQASEERRQAEYEYNDLKRTSDRIAAMIRRIETKDKGGSKGTGRMMWPVRGPITSPFGWRVHPILKKSKLHTGIDIAANHGVPVKAADAGTVLTSGWVGGYGYTVIINHGGGLTTLYAHNSALHVRVGATVQKGQTIALIGSTGYSTGPHCHFEVRLHGEVVNPMNYLP